MAATIGGLPPTHSTADAGRIDIRQLPVAFEAMDKDGASRRYHARFPNYDVLLDSRAIAVRLSEPMIRVPRGVNLPRSRNTATLKLSFQGTDKNSVPLGNDKLRGKANYFIGNDPKKWMKGVPLYGSVMYPNVYAGVDFLFQNHNGRLEYRIELDRGDAVHDIALRFSGHDALRLSAQGEIEVSTAVGQATWTAPKAFWDTAQGLIRAEVTYAIRDDGSVGFEIEGPLRPDPLIIDPELVFSTLLGGSGGDFITARDIADNGNIVVTGPTTSLNFPLSANPAQGNNRGSEDIFVTMLRPDASEIVFSTYLGGSSIEATNGIATMADGSVSICGFTLSTNFPTTPNAIQGNISGFLSAFVSQLSQSGDTLPFSSYLGGSSQDNCTCVAADQQDRLLLSGYTASQDFPTTPNAKSTQYQGGTSDGFFSVLRLDQPNIEYSTFLGGSGSEFEVIQLDVDTGVAIEFGLAPWLTIGDDGDVYLAGTTTSPDFVTTDGSSLRGSNSAFIMRLAGEDYSLKASTLLGGNMLDGATSIALSSNGKGNGSVVVGGLTSSSNFPTSSGAFQSTFGGGEFDAFLAVLDSNLQAVEYSTYVGGRGFDVFFADAAAGDRVHIGGMTSSSDLPSSPDALQPGFAGAVDGYLLTLNLGSKGTSTVEFSTYFGGVGQDILSRPATTPDGGVLLFGSSVGFRTTAGVVGEDYSGGPTDAAIFKVGGGMGGGPQNPEFTSAGLTNSASFVAGDVAEEEIIALFGLFLADFSESFSLPLGTQLGGANVDITDSQGVTRPCLMYVASSTPTLDQLNFIIAEGTAPGPGMLTVRRASGGSHSIAVNVVKAAPGIFTANAMGTGVPAANILRFGPGGVPIGGAELVTAAPIDLGPADQSAFLSLFLTGVRNGSTVQITINGVPMTTIFGPAPSPEFDGLDQLNVLIDRGLIGQGLVNVVVTIDGIVANVVQINIL